MTKVLQMNLKKIYGKKGTEKECSLFSLPTLQPRASAQPRVMKQHHPWGRTALAKEGILWCLLRDEHALQLQPNQLKVNQPRYMNPLESRCH